MSKRNLIFLIVLGLGGCLDKPDDTTVTPPNEIVEFVWGGLNSWYYWQPEVPVLADDTFRSKTALNQYLNTFGSPLDLFDELQHEDDRFSIIVDDYIELNNAFQGISKSFGYEFGLVDFKGRILGYVQYVLADSPAEEAGLQRGDLFGGVNGLELTRDNYIDLLFRSDEYTLTMMERRDGQIQESGDLVSMTAITLTENPVFIDQVIEHEGIKVAYLVYNRFTHTFHEHLNNAFARFVSEGATELVVDLRYNPGGIILTAEMLASMIYDDGDPNTIFSILRFNEKHSQFDRLFTFADRLSIRDGDFREIGTEPMNRLALSRVFFLTGSGTASASELTINGLEPYMDVIQIGTNTVGKNEGSLTLYDTPRTDYLSQEDANPTHRWALQPILFKVLNADEFGDYTEGLPPDIKLNESQFFDELLPLGDPNEPLLQAALQMISGSNSSGRTGLHHREIKDVGQSSLQKQKGSGMYLDGMRF